MKYRPKTSRQLTAILMAATLGLAAASSVADGKGQRMFDRADADGDGFLSIDEFKLQGPPEPRADPDGDGQITRAEFNDHASARGEDMLDQANERFSNMDLNGDDIVTRDEAREAAFNRLDQDQNGYLSPEEMKRPRHRHGERQG